MWKIVTPVVLFVAISLSSGAPEPGFIYMGDYMLVDEGNNPLCSCNDDGTRSCKVEAQQKVDLVSTWIVNGDDCKNMWITMMWDGLNFNSSTRAFTCPDICHDNNLVIHGDCETRVVTRGKHILENFRFSIPAEKGSQILDIRVGADFQRGEKVRDTLVGRLFVCIE